MEPIGARIPPGLVTLTAAYVQTVLFSALSTYYNHLATHFVKKTIDTILICLKVILLEN